MGDSIATNTFMLGYAYQKGWLQVGEAALLQAIELNGTAVAFNRSAFTWGRRAAVDLQRVRSNLEAGKVVSPDRQISQSLDEAVARRVEYLTAYQNAEYGNRYLSRVEQFSAAERALSGKPGELTEAVARYYFKVLAIKDEYEVARLFTHGEFLKKIEATFEGDYNLRFHLAPPLLNKAGPGVEPAKRSYGPWMLKGFKLLAKLKGIRNTWLDPFAYTHERKVEREWLRNYEQILEELLSGLTPDKLDTAVQLAKLPDAVRGYGAVKERYLAHVQQQQTRLLEQWHGTPPQFHDAGQADKVVRIHAAQL
jgi:indolepyruvate ferredoxin oxidoreductase